MAPRFRDVAAGLRRLVLIALLGSAAVVAQQPPPPPQAPPPSQLPSGTAMIAGRAIDSDTGQGIPGVFVSLTLAPGGQAPGPTIRVPPVLTDSQGRFVFSNLREGSYLVVAEPLVPTTAVLPRTIALGNGARITDITIGLTKPNTILGTVRDDTGDPVVGIEVVAFVRTVLQGRPATFQVRSRNRTDDRGQYRLNNLPAGRYFICACTRDVIPFDGQLLTTLAARPLDLLPVARRAVVAGADTASLDNTLQTYAPTFYPNTPLASRAERVSLEKGETKTGIDITAVTTRAVRVSGQIVGAPPSSFAASSLRLIPVGDIPEAVVITQLPPVLVQPDGRFDFASVPPGSYTLDILGSPGGAPGGPSGLALSFVGTRGAPAPPPPPPPPPPPGRGGPAAPPAELLWASETISVGTEDVTGLVIGVQRGMSIKGRFEFSGAAALPAANAGRGVVQLTPMETRPGRAAAYGAQINPDFTFEVAVPPGRYAMPFTPTFGPGWTTLKAITARGTDVFDAPIVVDRDIPDLVITLTDVQLPQILGTVDLPQDAIPDEWSVLIFPADRRFWKEPFAASRRFATARVTNQRTFSPRLPAGEYLLTLSHGLPADWMEAAVLEELAKGATTVTLVEGDKKAVQVKR